MILLMDPEFKKQLEIKDNLLRLKDEQVKTLESSLNLKDEQIKTLEISLNIKDDITKTLEKTIDLKEDEIRKLNASSIDKNVLKENDDKIQTLEKEIEILNGELAKADEELEGLELENEKLRDTQSKSTDVKIVDFTHANISKSEILEKMREILPNANASLLIVTPKIEDLQELYLYEIKASVSVRVGEELLYGVTGKSENNILVIHTKDPNHIKLLNALPLEVWIRSRKL